MNIFRPVVIGCLAACFCLSTAAFAQADRSSGPASVSPAPLKSGPLPLPVDQLQTRIAEHNTFHIFNQFEGATKSLQEQATSKNGPLKGGEIVQADLAGEALLGTPLAPAKGSEARIYMASVISIDAQAVKLRVDLSGLRPGEEVWVVDPVSLHSFGPYTVPETGQRAERWLPTIIGDEAVLLVKSSYDDAPQLKLTQYSHLFRSFEDAAKELSCNVNIACETDPETVDAASAVAIILIAGQWWCTGTLVNNGLTEALEPYMLTANHCICTNEEAADTEAVWDYRATSCGGQGPDIDTLNLRSFGEKLLATSSALDATLIQLDYVPVGPYGRIYLGWESRMLGKDERVKVIHHPQATHMRISKGSITAVGEDKNSRENQTKVHYDNGVTEAGSSGSALLLNRSDDQDNRIVGMLSQGTTHSCTTDINNLDWFASFHEFYSQIQPYIDSATPSTAQGADDCINSSSGSSSCPLSQAYSGAPAALAGLRTLRDKALMPTAAGRQFVDAYYKAAPTLGAAVKKSPAARAAVIGATAPFAKAGAFLKIFTH